jgi:phosphate transport system substrate-binding protein
MRFLLIILLPFGFVFGDMVLNCVGSTTIQPIIEQIAQKYKDERGISIKASGGGSQYAVDSLISGKIEVGMVSRDLTQYEKSVISYLTIGYDTLAFIVNSDNPLQNISKKDLLEIYTKEVENWKKFNTKDEKIHLLSKKIDRGTLDVFEKYTGLFHPQNPKNRDKTKMIDASAWEAGANNDMMVWVGGIPNSIGYISAGSAGTIAKHGLPIKILMLENVKPSKENVQNKSYPIRRELNLVFLKSNKEAEKFANWMLEEYGQKSVEENLFIRAK